MANLYFHLPRPPESQYSINNTILQRISEKNILVVYSISHHTSLSKKLQQIHPSVSKSEPIYIPQLKKGLTVQIFSPLSPNEIEHIAPLVLWVNGICTVSPFLPFFKLKILKLKKKKLKLKKKKEKGKKF